MNLLEVLRGRAPARSASPSWDGYLDDLSQLFTFGGLGYGLTQTMGGSSGNGETIGAGFAGIVEGAYKRNGVVFACVLARMLLFTEARFQYQRMNSGRPGDLYGTRDLAVLERPGPNQTTRELLARIEQDASLAGNWYGTRRVLRSGKPGIKRLRPDWVTIVLGTTEADAGDAGPDDIDAEVLGYVFTPGGATSRAKPLVLLPEEVAHFSPIPDPLAHARGMSWLTPVLREISADSAATTHKLKFFDQGATPNMVVRLDKEVTLEAFKAFKAEMETEHRGHLNAYKTLYLGGGADVTVVGADFKQLDFKVTQGAGETRIAAAAGVPPIIVGLSEGLDASTYSNYDSARRKFADGWSRPQWGGVAGALETLAPPPDATSRLWYDDSHIPFLREDAKNAAEVRSVDAQAIKSLTDAGFTPDSVIEAVTTGDLTVLTHSGNFSVQLHPPGTQFTTKSSDKPAAKSGAAAD